MTFRTVLENSDLDLEYAKTIAPKLGIRHTFLYDFMKNNEINGFDLLTVVARKKMKPIDVATAIIGNPDNDYFKKLMKVLKTIK